MSMRTLSHSQIELFTQCPKRWQLTRIERVAQAPAEALIFGDALHQAIEASGKRFMEQRQHLGLSALLAVFNTALEQRLAEDDPLGLLSGQLLPMRLKGLAALRAWSDQVAPLYAPVSVEERFEVTVPALGEDEADVSFTGIVDGRTQREGWTTIVDWKTAGRPWPVGIEHSKEQASAYLMADLLTSGREPVANRVTFIVLATVPDGEGFDCTPEFRTTRRTMEQLVTYADGVRATARAMDEAEASGMFPARTGPLCGWCACLGACTAGRQWMQERGRRPMVPVLSAAGEVVNA